MVQQEGINKMKLSVVSKSYRLDVPLEDFKFIMKDESFANGSRYLFWDKITKVVEIYDVEYNRRYGPAIFYTVNAEDDTEELHKKIQDLFISTVKQLKGEI